MDNPPGVDLFQFPTRDITSGSTYFVGSESLERVMDGITAAMISLSAFFLVCRLWANRHRFSWPDAFTIVAFVICVGYAGLTLWRNHYVRHRKDIGETWFTVSWIKTIFVLQILRPLSHMASKTAVLLLLLRIFSVNKTLRIAIAAGIGGVVLVYSPNLVLGAYYMTRRRGEGWRGRFLGTAFSNVDALVVEEGALGVVLDLYIFFLPFPALARLRLQPRKRLQLGLVFGTAFMGVIASAVGLPFRVTLLDSHHTRVELQVIICTLVEIYITLIVSCLPGFASFFQTHISNTSFYKSLASLVRSRRTTSDGGDGGTGPPGSESWRMRVTIGGTGHPGVAGKKKSKHDDRDCEAPDTIELISSQAGSEIHEPALAVLNGESRIVMTRSVDQCSHRQDVEGPEDARMQRAERMV
ncbi:hypothetical protein N3K66_005917 [Trichothecium roseum]|uniref:Uncharacterized protein n=1 Tax=Trichothecium roseum TaxID=47278 RepID=A0ACC0UZS0_9HYPO|nr:hypothetical protein N3K66_005917 [Trichothecium roseum]